LEELFCDERWRAELLESIGFCGFERTIWDNGLSGFFVKTVSDERSDSGFNEVEGSLRAV
jgi:hypothetical protein